MSQMEHILLLFKPGSYGGSESPGHPLVESELSLDDIINRRMAEMGKRMSVFQEECISVTWCKMKISDIVS